MNRTPALYVFANGRHLAAARSFAGLSQRELAERTGFHVNTVKYHERSRVPVYGRTPDQFALEIAKLGVDAVVERGRAVVRASMEDQT